jgi:hypothetical protein
MKVNQNFLNAWNIKEIIDVPVANDEYKETPIPQKCHQNVARMQMKYGGQTVLGFGFYQLFGLDDINVEPHSVWKRPDESYVDVSLGYANGNDEMLNPIVDVPPKSILFAPLKHFDSSKEFYDIYERYVLYKKEIVRMYAGNIETHSYDFFGSKDLTQLIFHRNKSVLESENWKEFLEERESA